MNPLAPSPSVLSKIGSVIVHLQEWRDICDFSRNNGWPVAPGRGSAPGSLVCYLLGITELDPLKWGLSFNRFLSPSRGGYMLKCVMD